MTGTFHCKRCQGIGDHVAGYGNSLDLFGSVDAVGGADFVELLLGADRRIGLDACSHCVVGLRVGRRCLSVLCSGPILWCAECWCCRSLIVRVGLRAIVGDDLLSCGMLFRGGLCYAPELFGIVGVARLEVIRWFQGVQVGLLVRVGVEQTFGIGVSPTALEGGRRDRRLVWPAVGVGV
ncbi:hypothetical protein CRH09_15340 [Nocardia terpenica]|uniref:Uncharacterized protein n=1 Tax=Nocardia terpenica TaxID=455432 RepID=A0A291RIF8_9NOCA|nr:hypothetical protein CRH09_15340 [Nocardia terpenica]